MTTYEPGTVRGVPGVRVMRWVDHGRGVMWTDVQPIVVIHPAENPYNTAEWIDWIEGQYEAQMRPPKPEVYEHLGIDESRVGNPHIFTALCGKVWVPGQDVTVLGKCPNCSRIAEDGWLA